MKIRYLIPNFFTTISLLAGLLAMNFIINSRYPTAAWIIFLAIIIDGLDGKTARLLKASTDFGALYDTLSDFFVFGIMPAFLIYKASLEATTPLGVIPAVIFTLFGAFRLIRYTIAKDKSILTTAFHGLPIPAAAGVVASLILIDKHLWDCLGYHQFISVMIILVSFLMISRIRYAAVEKENYSVPKRIILLILITVFINFNQKI